MDLHVHDSHFIGLLCGVPPRLVSTGTVEGDTVTYLGTALGSFNDELRASMRGVVSRTAGDLVGSVEEALAQCLDVGIWPFHRANADVKEAHVAWLTAERDRLRAIAEEDAAFDDGYDEVRQLGREAAATLEG